MKCQACGKAARGEQRALVAFGCIPNNGSGIVLEATPGLEEDMREAGIDAGDVWDVSDGGELLQVWEGHIITTRDYDGDVDVDYKGTFRSLTVEEWERLRNNLDLWPLPE